MKKTLLAFAFILSTAFATWSDITISSSTGLTSGGTFVNGAVAADKAGTSVSYLGLFNNDAYPDYAVGTAKGKAYVILGKSSARTTALDFATVSSTDFLTMTSPYSTIKCIVASAGRHFATGRDALIMAFPDYDTGSAPLDIGIVHVVYQRDTSLDFSSTWTTGASYGYKITAATGQAANDMLGYAVASAGEVTADTLDDILVTLYGTNKVYVVPGVSTTPADVEVTAVSTTAIAITKPTSSTSFGASLAGNFDFNGDGKDDFIIGEPTEKNAYVINGQTTAIVAIAMATDTTKFTKLTSTATTTNFGYSVAGYGDINNDGVDDVIVGAPLYDRTSPTAAGAGRAYVIYGQDMNSGSTVGTKVADIADVDAITPTGTTKGYYITGVTASSNLGLAVDGVGDINGDGYDDIIVGAPYASGSRSGAIGKVYLIYGQASANAANIDLSVTSGTTLWSSTRGITILGVSSSEFGATLSHVGDVTGDGYPDFVIGAPSSDAIGTASARATAGIVYQINGQAATTTTTGSGFRLGASFLVIVSFFAALMF